MAGREDHSTEENKEQILSVKNLNGFGDDNFADFKFEISVEKPVSELETEDKKSLGSDSDSPTDVMSDTSDVTARVTDSQSDTSDSDDSKSSSGSDTPSNSRSLQFTIKDVSSEDAQKTANSTSPHPHILPPPPPHLSTTGRSRELGIVADSNSSQGKALSFEQMKNNVNRGLAKNINSTIMEDESSKYFTVIHDAPPQGGTCKKCPRIKLSGLRAWWKVQQK